MWPVCVSHVSVLLRNLPHATFPRLEGERTALRRFAKRQLRSSFPGFPIPGLSL